jgi:hypothetical protein
VPGVLLSTNLLNWPSSTINLNVSDTLTETEFEQWAPTELFIRNIVKSWLAWIVR